MIDPHNVGSVYQGCDRFETKRDLGARLRWTDAIIDLVNKGPYFVAPYAMNREQQRNLTVRERLTRDEFSDHRVATRIF
jgi:hypothetical protein